MELTSGGTIHKPLQGNVFLFPEAVLNRLRADIRNDSLRIFNLLAQKTPGLLNFGFVNVFLFTNLKVNNWNDSELSQVPFCCCTFCCISSGVILSNYLMTVYFARCERSVNPDQLNVTLHHYRGDHVNEPPISTRACQTVFSYTDHGFIHKPLQGNVFLFPEAVLNRLRADIRNDSLGIFKGGLKSA